MSPEQFLQIADHLSDPALLVSEEGRILAATERVSELGLQAGEMEGRLLADLVDEPPQSVASYLESCLDGAAPVVASLTLRRGDASRLACRCDGSALGESEARGVLLRLRPADLLRPEEALRERVAQLSEAEERLRSIFDHVIDGIVTIDERGSIQSFNPAAERLFGYEAREVVGKNVSVLMPEPYHSEHDLYLENYLQTGLAKIIGIGREVVGRRKDGSIFPMYLGISEFRLREGRYFTGIVQDVTERKRAEETARFLAEASATLALLVDYRSTLQSVAQLAVPFFADWCAVDLVEDDGSIQRIAVSHLDPAKVELAQELHHRWPPSPDADIGSPYVLRTGQSQLIAQITPAMIQQAARSDEHLRLLRELNPRSAICAPIMIRGSAIGALTFAWAESGREYGPADLTVAEDLTHRAAIAIENARLYAELRETDRRKDEFLAMLAHELRNPLAPIVNALAILDLPGLDAELTATVRRTLERQVEQLVRIVDDLLDVSRIMRGKVTLQRERVELATVVERAVETARPIIEAQRHQLKVSLPSEPVPLEADTVRLAQVISNLLNNAAKYTPAGGRIWLSAERGDGSVAVRVRDTGIGIDPELLPKIFDLFTQADRSLERSQGGLGIGLTIVRSLVEMHGGKVSVQSGGLGRGSEFSIELPVLREIVAIETPPPTEAEVAPRRVLVVDDNRSAARMLEILLTRLWGHQVRLAHDGHTALREAETFQPEVVLLDIGLPGVSGYDVARRLRQQPQFKDALLVAVTGYGQDEDRRLSHEAGFDAHLVKPPSVEDLRGVFTHPKLAR